ncbi:uncharacterized protein TRIADDRAFT_51299 [Trichoplax adhaerens]|uniref:CSN12-like protein n=1 Tax=Trichoplax adhaerens TaxID=10228 RepID=B3RIF3_TRIAD|nr:hypothetical protein TRIADDRAFT_51299 [Trichoplax adhaerens]EDV29225.1 hypothetical protein TRIADDRAFT_51299 [Trichoplax adhaerens]|eukprot:XP_002108427.1 hypothetical protein TRIADDRAFT_51299 [Trichoplax adhaerens]
MAFNQSFTQYLGGLENAINNKDGRRLGRLLSIRDSHIQNPGLKQREDVIHHYVCQRFVPPYVDLVADHMKVIAAINHYDPRHAFDAQLGLMHSFARALQSHKDENWGILTMYVVISELTALAFRVYYYSKGKSTDVLEKTAEALMNCFRVCAGDSRSALENSKKWGMLGIVNNLFKIYFKLNKLHLCKPLTRAISSAAIKDDFLKSHIVTYRYYVGRKAMFDSQFKEADENLSFAFNHCHVASRKNKRLILMYLLPVKMMLGYIPSNKLLSKYRLTQFIEIASAVKIGNLLKFNQAIEKHQKFLIRCGVYLMLERLKMLIFRNLFKKVFLLMQTYQLPISAFVVALSSMQEEGIDADEVECILANLIYTGYVRGYISHQHQKLVVSKQNPFPVPSQVAIR